MDYFDVLTLYLAPLKYNPQGTFLRLLILKTDIPAKHDGIETFVCTCLKRKLNKSGSVNDFSEHKIKSCI